MATEGNKLKRWETNLPNYESWGKSRKINTSGRAGQGKAANTIPTHLSWRGQHVIRRKVCERLSERLDPPEDCLDMSGESVLGRGNTTQISKSWISDQTKRGKRARACRRYNPSTYRWGKIRKKWGNVSEEWRRLKPGPLIRSFGVFQSAGSCQKGFYLFAIKLSWSFKRSEDTIIVHPLATLIDLSCNGCFTSKCSRAQIRVSSWCGRRGRSYCGVHSKGMMFLLKFQQFLLISLFSGSGFTQRPLTLLSRVQGLDLVTLHLHLLSSRLFDSPCSCMAICLFAWITVI